MLNLTCHRQVALEVNQLIVLLLRTSDELNLFHSLIDGQLQVIEVNIDEFRENMQYAYDKMVSTGAVTQEQVDRMMEIVENARQ